MPFPRKVLFERLQNMQQIPRRRLARIIAAVEPCCNLSILIQERLLFLSSMKGAEDYRKEFLEEGTTFIDLLNDFLSLQPPLEEILDKLPPQQPRYYSHVTSPLASPTTLRFAFSLVRWRSSLKGRSRRGICTDWLYRLSVRHGFVEAIDEEDTAILVHEAEAERRVKEQEGYEANTTTIPLFARPARVLIITYWLNNPFLLLLHFE